MQIISKSQKIQKSLKNDKTQNVAIACMLLASKVEGIPQKIQKLVATGQGVLDTMVCQKKSSNYSNSLSSFSNFQKKAKAKVVPTKEYKISPEEVTKMETLLVCTLGFDFKVENCMKDLDGLCANYPNETSLKEQAHKVAVDRLFSFLFSSKSNRFLKSTKKLFVSILFDVLSKRHCSKRTLCRNETEKKGIS